MGAKTPISDLVGDNGLSSFFHMKFAVLIVLDDSFGFADAFQQFLDHSLSCTRMAFPRLQHPPTIVFFDHAPVQENQLALSSPSCKFYMHERSSQGCQHCLAGFAPHQAHPPQGNLASCVSL